MEFENKAPKWDATGAEPSADLQANGFSAGYKPPAAYFNYLFNAYTKCINELQAILSEGQAEGALPLTGGELSGELIVNENFQVRKSYDNVPYRSYVRPVNYSIASNGDYSTGLIHYKDGVNNAQLMFNKDGVMLRDNVNTKAYQMFGQHNTDLIKGFCLPLTGGVLGGNLDFKKVENGSGTIYKNHSETADYGMLIRDVAPNGNYSQLQLCANENTLKYRDTAGKTYDIYGGHKTVPVSNGGTGRATLTANSVLVGDGTNAVGLRAISNLTAKGAATASVNIPTVNTVVYDSQARLNRTTLVNAADTAYTTYMARAVALVTAAPTSMTNGCVAFVYA